MIDLLSAALRIGQVIGAEETPTGAQLANGLASMTALCKGWQGSGIHVWCEEEGILFLQPGQTLYYVGAGTTDQCTLWDTLIQTSLAALAAGGATTINVDSIAGINAGDNIGIQLDTGLNFWTTVEGTPSGSSVGLNAPLPSQASAGFLVFDYTVPLYRPLRVMGGRRYDYLSKIDIPMMIWSRLDYAAQPNKYTTGTPTAFFYDPQTGQGQYSQPQGQWNSWPTPQSNVYGARFTGQRPIQDVGNLANIPDFPVEWEAALKWNLALEIAPENGVPMEQMQIIVKQAERWYQMASTWDRESESILFGVAFSPGQRRG